MELWHNRLGHPHRNKLMHLFTTGLIKNDLLYIWWILLVVLGWWINVEGYLFILVFHHLVYLIDLIHTAVWSSHTTSRLGFKYFVSFINYHTRHTWLYLIKQKSGVFFILKPFMLWLKLSLIPQSKFSIVIQVVNMCQKMSVWHF